MLATVRGVRIMPRQPFDDPRFLQYYRVPQPPTEADEDLADRVAARLRADLSPVGHAIVVEVQNRVVVLEGGVPDHAMRAQAHAIVWRVPGVHDVCNRLSAWSEDTTFPT
jgi:hypothetical protein